MKSEVIQRLNTDCILINLADSNYINLPNLHLFGSVISIVFSTYDQVIFTQIIRFSALFCTLAPRAAAPTAPI